MGVWFHHRPFERAFDVYLINSWAAGALDSAWRAVDQYLTFNHPKSIRDTFWDKWGPNEYWDDASKKTIDQDHKLTNRHLVIGLDESGFTFQ